MALSAIKFVIIVSITMATLCEVNCQITAIGPGFQQTISLLSNVTNSSAAMNSILHHLQNSLNNQQDLQIVANMLLENNTASVDEMVSILPEIIVMLQDQWKKQDEYQNGTINVLQSQLDAQQDNHNEIETSLNDQQQTLSLMAETQNQTLNKLCEIGETQSQMAEMQSLMANTFNQVVTLLQMQSHQLHNISASINTMVSVLENISHLLDKQTDQIELLNQCLPVPVNDSDIAVEDQLQNSTAPMNTMGDILETQAAETQSQQQVTVASTMATQLVTQQDPPRDCSYLATRGNYPSGSYTIKPSDSLAADVYCDMDTDGGGWTVFQHRFNGSVNFYRGWEDYENGFGDVNGEYWAGLRLLHVLTSSGSASRLRIELEAFDGDTAYAEYESFTVGNSSSNYILTIGSYSGNATDCLGYHNNMQFSTYDRDNDVYSSTSCAVIWQGAWWYKTCHRSHLNGQYLGSTETSASGMIWHAWKSLYSLKTSTMMLRRTP
ncbi:uncharacterized protein [Amphiura filiformis]|uniref:uncharacterized protein n=1 Tax=Amphiura filiformis TaxID=82378 RepID=UPI003B226447